jgi:predicted aldo/keto reductase-like oxidoreductase
LNNGNTVKEVLNEMEESVQESLKALQTDYVDIMLLHGMTQTMIINHEEIMSFFQGIKQRGLTRAVGFSTHSNMAEVILSNNNSGFYDTVMCAFNHKGAYIHSRNGRHHSWNQEALIRELQQAKANGIGIVAMKTTSAGPFQPDNQSEATYKDSLKWVLQHDFVSTTAVAIANFQQLDENVKAMQ